MNGPLLRADEPVGCEIGQDPVEFFFGQAFIIVIIDLHHRPGAAGGQTFDRAEGEESVGRRFARTDSEFAS